MGEKETMTASEARQTGSGATAVPGGEPEPAEAANLNPSKSGAYREAGGGDGEPEPTEGAIVKSKSNITNNREAGSGDGEPELAEGAIVKSKSNITNNREAGGGDGEPQPADGAIIKSKSNITNNREAGGQGEPEPDESISLNSSRAGL